MADLQHFHFLRPSWLFLLLPLAALAWYLFRHRSTAGVWQDVCDDALLPFLLVKRESVKNRLNPWMFGLIGVLAITALAGPTWERLPSPVFRDESALVILLDLSRSMNAQDLNPSRLERAKFKVSDILNLRKEGQSALIVYSGDAHVVTPLTTDVATIAAHLPALATNIMPSRGANASQAIKAGIDLLKQAGIPNGELLLVTDGLQDDDFERATALATESKARLSVLGVGTSEGAPIPNQSGGFISDEKGAIVVEVLDTDRLQALATSGRGMYQGLRTDDADVRALVTHVDQETSRRSAAATELFTDRWREFGPWLLVAILPFAPLAFRRGVLSVVLCCGFSTMAGAPAEAAWWLTPDQQAQKQFEGGEFDSAAETFENPQWRAAAAYRAQQYEHTLSALEQATSPDDWYNKGNALARLGRLEEAVEAYEQTLSAVSEHEDAAYNKALLEKLIEEQQQEEQSSNDSADQSEQDTSGENGGEESSDQQSNQQGESPSQDSAQEASGSDENSAASTSSEQSSKEPAEQKADETDEEQRMSEQKSDEARPDEAFAQANAEMENEQATEQWLRQIPDDPGGLLRRKFEYEYQKRNAALREGKRRW